MSFFDDASLAFLPSGAAGKDGKAYSIKPTDGTGDFTFSRGSNLAATRVGADGLIEKGRENLIKQSNNFHTTPWSAINASVTPNATTAPDGTLTASKIVATSVNAQHRVDQTTTSSSGVKTFSVYVKQSEITSTWLRIGTTGCFIDLTNGAISSISSGIIASVVALSNDWYRCSITKTNATANEIVRINAGTSDYLGDDVIGIFVWRAQYEEGLAATDVISTGATTGKAGLLEDEPRFDYSGGATCPSLLLEPSRTQLFEQSEYFGGWSLNPSGISSIEPNYAISPEGVKNAYKVNFVVQGDSDLALVDGHSVTGGSTYAYSIYIKGEGSDIGKDIVVKSKRSGGDSAGTTTFQTLTDEWVRVDFTTTYAANNTAANFYISSNDATSCLIYGAQAEEGSYPTSYIPNHSGGSVTRGVDVATGAGDATTFNDSEGVLYAEISTLSLSDTSERQITISDTSKNSYLRIQYGGTPGMIYLFLYINGVKVADIRKDSLDTTNKHKVAIRYGSAGYSGFVDGVLIETDAYAGNFVSYPLNSLDFFQWKGNAKQILYFPTTLSDAECISLTS